MRQDSERDESMDRLLASAFRTGASGDRGACVGPDVIAAWSAGTLSRPEADQVERHLSHCAVCQRVLAVFARSAPPVETNPSIWARWRLRALVPIAAAATAVAIWVAAPGDRPEDILREQQKRAAAPGTSDAPGPSAAAGAPPAAARDADSLASERLPERGASANTAAQADASAKPAERFDAAAPERDAVEAERLADSSLADRRLDGAPSAAAAPAPAPPAPAPPAAAAPASAAQAPASARAAQEAAPLERRERAVALQASPAPLVIVSPDPSNRWRVGPNGAVERSTTAGQSWDSTNIESGSPLTAGASPAPLVSWLVGPRATVLRTVNGSTFERVQFPESVDLVAVSADSASVAVVTAADGRRFRTEDGGQSWSVVGP